MEFEQILKQIGSLGRYQLFILSLILYCNQTLIINVCFMVYGKWDISPLINCTMDNNVSCTVPFRSVVMEFDLREGLGHIPSVLDFVLMLGFLIGAFIAGFLADLYGRKPIWLCGILFMGIFGAISAASPAWEVFLVFRFLIGFFSSVYLVVGATILLEVTSKSHRLWMIEVCMLWELGFGWFSLLAYLTKNWRTVAVTANLQLVPVLFAYIFVYESPRWMISKRRFNESLIVIGKIAKRNGKSKSIKTESTLITTETERKSIAPISWRYFCHSREIKVSLLALCFCSFAVFCTEYGLLFNAGALLGNKFLNVTLFGCIKVVPITLVILTDRYLKFGRKTFMVTGLLGCFFSMITVSVVRILRKTDSLAWLLNLATIVGSCIMNPAICICYLYPAELFPSEVRSRATGIVATFSRIGSILSPVILYLNSVWDPLPFLVLACITVCGAAVVAKFLPETRGNPLPELQLEEKRSEKDTDFDP